MAVKLNSSGMLKNEGVDGCNGSLSLNLVLHLTRKGLLHLRGAIGSTADASAESLDIGRRLIELRDEVTLSSHKLSGSEVAEAVRVKNVCIHHGFIVS